MPCRVQLLATSLVLVPLMAWILSDSLLLSDVSPAVGLGLVDGTSAALWLWVRLDARGSGSVTCGEIVVNVSWWEVDGREGSALLPPYSMQAALESSPYMRSCVATVRLDQLQSRSRYEYSVTFAVPTRSRQDVRRGTFRTFMKPGESGSFSVVLGSCLQSIYGVPMFSLGRLRGAGDMFLFLGDAVYADAPFNFFSSYEHLYTLLLRDPYFSSLTSTTPSVFMYDDHEISNNWDGGETGLFADAIGNWTWFLGRRNRDAPPGSPPRARFFSFMQGDVSFMVLDTRAYRNTSAGTMLGKEQLRCVREWLESSRGSDGVKLRVIVSSVPFTLNTGNLSYVRSDGWAGFQEEREALLGWIHEMDEPVLFLSGDMHWSAIFMSGGILEVSSSPLFQFPMDPRMSSVQWNEEPIFYASMGLFHARLDFNTSAGEVKISISQASWWSGEIRELWVKTFTLEDLKPRKKKSQAFSKSP
ncbi:hypothetical protein GUITHDRAFT_141605 [Guillardia theta CCMP2712]|uniref:PhoD-like phosphatase metallophosphatase domain-containing protein n=2 Tax=Guillardia theta TaxID=55529 RepID=L1J0N1_GUITC|nr:hypothetical protein GUITHDRAFT_141605 [Guillardia theta CCMP2712]EKX41847.1 hypothetical protein GUITHDRAFT_141605 [Guillardia theta CCMP2712]|eukprot:XP_005828827.1 hypothetical protein GUITHDRAFT_141605 [Guillardia theta CCMP2712]